MKKSFIILVTLLVLLFSGCVNVIEEKPARIAFAGIENDRKGWYVFSMQPDGSDRILLARHLNLGHHDQWWSDNGRLVFIEGAYREPAERLSVIDADGTNHRRVLDISGMVISLMAISPDGETILLVCRAATPRENPEGQAPEDMGTTTEFYNLDVNSGAIKRLTDTPDIRKEAVAFSPDGKKIAFIGCTNDPSTHHDIYVMNADGTALRKLTNHESSMMLHDRSLQWSPDSRKVLFSMDNVFISDIRHYGDLFIVDVNSDAEVNLTDSVNNDDVEARWSPDGKKIVFTSSSHSNDREAAFSSGVYVMDPDSSDLTKLSDNLSQAAWLPDSQRLLAVRRDAERSYSLVIVDSKDRTIQTLLECAKESEYQFSVAYYPVWLPR